jgi:hypothetical protein
VTDATSQQAESGVVCARANDVPCCAKTFPPTKHKAGSEEQCRLVVRNVAVSAHFQGAFVLSLKLSGCQQHWKDWSRKLCWSCSRLHREPPYGSRFEISSHRHRCNELPSWSVLFERWGPKLFACSLYSQVISASQMSQTLIIIRGRQAKLGRWWRKLSWSFFLN